LTPARTFLACLVALSAAACHPSTQQTTATSPVRTACLAERPVPAVGPDKAGMVLIKGGAFQMGARPMHDEEGPPRTIKVGDFWMDATEVTNGDFARFVKATGYVTQAERPLDPRAYPGVTGKDLEPSAIVFVGSEENVEAGPGAWWQVVRGADWRHPQGPDTSIQGLDHLPVVQIGWEDAMAYAKWLGRDLPTEAEWEYAAQGGKPSTRFVWGDEPLNDAKPQANVWQGTFPGFDTGGDGYKAQIAPVGCFPGNGFGLHDMAGNVWEWTRDWYRPNLDPDDPNGGPSGDLAMDPGDPGVRKHVIKGGSYLCAPNYCFRYRPAAREAGPTDTGESHIGFRTVLRVKG
jgi:formylglycine-generating enzyme required for sulfatase activity